MTTDQAFLFIQWDDEGHGSPRIGPYRNITEARRDATAIRKALRANGATFRYVKVEYLRPREVLWGWDALQPKLEVVA